MKLHAICINFINSILPQQYPNRSATIPEIHRFPRIPREIPHGHQLWFSWRISLHRVPEQCCMVRQYWSWVLEMEPWYERKLDEVVRVWQMCWWWNGLCGNGIINDVWWHFIYYVWYICIVHLFICLYIWSLRRIHFTYPLGNYIYQIVPHVLFLFVWNLNLTNSLALADGLSPILVHHVLPSHRKYLGWRGLASTVVTSQNTSCGHWVYRSYRICTRH